MPSIPHLFTPRGYQIPAYNALAEGIRRGIFIWHRRSGKDKTFLNIMIKEMVKRVGNYYYYFPWKEQGKKALWNGRDKEGMAFMDHFPKELVAKSSSQEMQKILTNGSLFQVLGTNDPDSIVGPNPVGVVYSEWPIMKEMAWDLVRPILRENGGWAFFNGTPRGMNHAYKMFLMAQKNPKWMAQHLTVEQTFREDGRRVITEEDLEEERQEEMPEWLIEQEYFCSWVASQENIYISPALVLEATKRELSIHEYDFAPRTMGVDLARFGSDSCALVRRQGLMMWPPKVWRDLDPLRGGMEMVDHIISEIMVFHPDAVFIDSGYMPGVIDRLNELGWDKIVQGVGFGERSGDPAFANKTSEMAGEFKDWLLDGGVLPFHDQLITEASNVYYGMNRKGQVQLISKEDLMKKYGLPSPNCLDAAKLNFAHHVYSREPDDLTKLVRKAKVGKKYGAPTTQTLVGYN